MPRGPGDEPTAPSETSPRAAAEGLRDGDVVDGRYRVVRRVDQGGMSDVYEAVHTAVGHRVALKVPHRRLADDAGFVVRFLGEARALQRVRHPHVVRALDCGSDRGLPYLAMELLDGETLRDAIAREAPMPASRALSLLRPVLDALACVHDAGLVHRDVKPSNVMLARADDGVSPTLLDFGIARDVDDARGLTASGAPLGTPSYMSPEQCRGDRDLTPATDQYAAAVVLYEALTGRLPHEAATANLALVARITRPPTPITAWRRDLAPHVAHAVMRALSTEPAARFGSVTALRDALATAPTRPRRWRVAALAGALAVAGGVGVARRPMRSASRAVEAARAPSVEPAVVAVAPSVAAPSVVARAVDETVTGLDAGAIRAVRVGRAPRGGDDPRLRMTIFREIP